MKSDLAPDGAWGAIGEFLARDLLVLDPDSRRDLSAEFEEISRCEAAIDDRLCVGLVGGTGVGKSTLINALAGAAISTTGARRPTTDRVVAYRHRKTLLPDGFPREHVATPEIEHERLELERVILLDFPDFDSVEEAHEEILEACLPHLDVLLVLVDDMKYGDERLFALFRRLAQSPENLYVVFNKIDRLRRRYSDAVDSVVEGILTDFAAKLERYAAIRLGRDRVFAISAERAFLERSGNAPPASAPSGRGAPAGEFSRVIALLDGYRAEKRRRAAKELNIDARKAALRTKLEERALDPQRLIRVEGALGALRARRGDLEGLFRAISPEILSSRERRTLVRQLARGGALGFPADLILRGAREIFRAKSETEAPVELTAARARAHYVPFLDAVETAMREARLEAPFLTRRGDRLGELLERGADFSPDFASIEGELRARIEAASESRSRAARFSNHVAPVAVLLGYLWWMLYPAAVGALEKLSGVEGATWSAVLRKALFGLLGGLHPLRLAGLAAAVGLAYAVSAYALWLRRSQKIETAISEAEAALRERLWKRGSEALESVEAALERWLAERSEAERLLGRAG